MFILPGAAVIFILVASVLYFIWHSRRRSPLPLPPGPKGIWGLGNLLDFPKSHYWRRFTEWSAIYGDVVSLKVLGQPFVILNTIESAKDLFEKRGSGYSDRPSMPMVGELMGFDRSMALIHYGDVWKMQRKMANQILNSATLESYVPVQERIVAHFVKRLLDDPQSFKSLVHFTSGRILLTCTYGVEIDDPNDSLLRDTQESLDHIQKAITIRHAVDFFPFLKHVPSWLPFTNFKREAKKSRELFDHTTMSSFAYAKQELERGSDIASFASSILKERGDSSDPKEDEAMKWAVATLFGAGEEAIAATILSFLYSMIVNPEVQIRAQKELDLVVGTDRLPNFSDKPKLPYINAIIKEIWRWRPPAPLAVPHRSMKADVYEGMYIPPGSIVISNLWAISRQMEDGYPTEEFIPERFLGDNPSALDPLTYIFGVGRRVCPGRHFAENVAFLFISNILACFMLSRSLDANGDPEPINHTFTDGAGSYPAELKLSITPRSEKTRDMVLESLQFFGRN